MTWQQRGETGGVCATQYLGHAQGLRYDLRIEVAGTLSRWWLLRDGSYGATGLLSGIATLSDLERDSARGALSAVPTTADFAQVTLALSRMAT
jgi:hypothetical protein